MIEDAVGGASQPYTHKNFFSTFFPETKTIAYLSDMEKHDFKLVGLGRPKSATLERLDSDQNTFWATIDIPKDKVEELWRLCEGNWDDTKIAEVECDSLNEDGVPINARLVGIRFN